LGELEIELFAGGGREQKILGKKGFFHRSRRSGLHFR
jgi:hypothetical protein